MTHCFIFNARPFRPRATPHRQIPAQLTQPPAWLALTTSSSRTAKCGNACSIKCVRGLYGISFPGLTLVQTSVANGDFYLMQLLMPTAHPARIGLYTRSGRIGVPGRMSQQAFATLEEAKEEFARQVPPKSHNPPHSTTYPLCIQPPFITYTHVLPAIDLRAVYGEDGQRVA